MRIFVTHDAQGNIRSAVIPAQSVASELELVAQPGQYVTAIDATDVDAKKLGATEGDREARARLLNDISKSLLQHKVDVKNKKLVKKSG